MTKRRANGEGSIYKRSDGRWVGSVSLDNGRRQHLYGATRQEVSRKLNAALKARQDGLPVLGERQTVGQFLQSWLETTKAAVRPRTWVRYEQYVRLHAIPGIGRVALTKLTPQHLQRLYTSRLEAGLSPTSVAHLHTVLHGALSQATKWGLTSRNVASLVTPPRIQHRQMVTFSEEQARTFLDAARGDRLEALYVLAVTTGMRQGELLALRWPDVDLGGGTVQVKATLQKTRDGFTFAEPKTARSRRQVALTDAAIASLREHRARQSAERLWLGTAWEDNDLVFANQVGRPIEATNLLDRSFRPLLARAGLPRVRFHDLRHTAATLLLGQGMHPKIVSDMLGHATIAVTLDLYSHTTPAMHRQAALAMDAILRG